MTTGAILVSWISFNNDPFDRERNGKYIEPRVQGPTLEILFGADSPIRGRVKRVYLFARRAMLEEPGQRPVHGREEEVVAELQREIAERAGRLKVEVRWWNTEAPPTSHRDVFLFAARELAAIRRTHPGDEIVVYLSPGTPAKHATLLLALQARIAGDNARAYQGTPPSKRREGDGGFLEVPWNLLSELGTSVPPSEAQPRDVTWSIDVARSALMRRVADEVAQFAGVPFPVLIIGSRGTGKTEIARRLRDGYCQWKLDASRRDWDFRLNCAEFRGDPNMLRSELFGHAKGSHSTAERDRPGLLEKAAHDCVFLDEIHWMDPQAQGLLLVALQRAGYFRRIGDDGKVIPAQFRLLAATNQTRDALRERLTADFLDRVSDLVIELPELRDCHEDLDEIWHSVVRRACEELLARDRTRTSSADGSGSVEAYAAEFRPHHRQILDKLKMMRLPGNFRDLERFARRLLVAGLVRSRFLTIRKEHVDRELDRLAREECGDRASGTGADSLLEELPTVDRCEEHLRAARDSGTPIRAVDLVDEWERRLLVAARHVAGSGGKAADLVGMVGRTFNDKLQKHDPDGIDRSDTQRRSRMPTRSK